MKIIGRITCLILMSVGLFVFFKPNIEEAFLNQQTSSIVERIDQLQKEDEVLLEPEITPESSESPAPCTMEKSELYLRMYNYNQELFFTSQELLINEHGYETVPDSLSDLDIDELGYISIPKMDVKLGLYLGATDKNMAAGATVLSQTSLPIGGENTNCVIAGHRGYRGIPYFREIEKLEAGDRVYITNVWETLTYEVESIDIISPTDSNKILIQEGKDMVTLLTCHPYRSHGKYRYLVYCVRVPDETPAEDTMPIEDKEETRPPHEYVISQDGAFYDSSEKDIQQELLIRRIGLFVVILSVGVLVWSFFCPKKGRSNPKPVRENHLS